MATAKRLNFFQSNRAVLTIHQLSDLNLTINGFPIPGINLPAAIHPTPFRNVPVYGDKLDYEPLTVEFLVNEDLTNWKEIHDWMRGLAAPEDKSEFRNRSVTYSDATAVIYSSHNNPLLRVRFHDLVPISLNPIDVTEQDAEAVYRVATATFEYERYDFF